MTRPIIWAVCTVVGTAAWATMSTDKLATKLGFTSARSGPVAPAQASSAVAGENVLTLDGDLVGHFTAHPSLDGRRIRMLVDTGATYVALSYEDAMMIGLKVEPRDFTVRLSTANGVASAARTRIGEVKLGEITVRNVDAIVAQRGAMRTSLLGMSFLKRLKGFEVSKGRLTLRG